MIFPRFLGNYAHAQWIPGPFVLGRSGPGYEAMLGGTAQPFRTSLLSRTYCKRSRPGIEARPSGLAELEQLHVESNSERNPLSSTLKLATS